MYCSLKFLLVLHVLLLFWTFIDGSTCIHPQRTPRKRKFWKFCAIRETGCIDAHGAAFLGRGGHRACAPSPGWQRCHCVAVHKLCLRAAVLTLQSASLAGADLCFKCCEFPLEAAGDRWRHGSLSASIG